MEANREEDAMSTTEASPRELGPDDRLTELDAFFENVREDALRGLNPFVQFAWRWTHSRGHGPARPIEGRPSEAD